MLNRCFLEKLLLLLSNYWNPHLRHDTSLQKEKKNQVLQFVLSILRRKKRKQAAVETAGPTLAANYFSELQRGFLDFFTSVKNCFIASFVCVAGCRTEEQTQRGMLMKTKQIYFKELFRLKKKKCNNLNKEAWDGLFRSRMLRVEMKGSRKRASLNRSPFQGESGGSTSASSASFSDE